MKRCSTCKQKKDVVEFYNCRTNKDGLSYRCKNCLRKYNSKCQEKIKIRTRVYYKEHKREIITKHKKWYRENLDYFKKYYKEHRYKYLIRAGVWKRENPEKWKKILKINHAKRKRNLNWIPLFNNPFDGCEEIEDHHINDTYIVFLPKDLHRLGGVYSGRNTKTHRINLSYIVEQLYDLNSGDKVNIL